MMKLAFKGGNDDEEDGNKEIEGLAGEDSDEDDEEGDDVEEEGEKKEEVSAKPGFLRRATNTVKASSKRTVTGIIGTRMTNSEVSATRLHTFRQSSVSTLSVSTLRITICVAGLGESGRGFIRVASKPPSSSHPYCWQAPCYEEE